MDDLGQNDRFGESGTVDVLESTASSFAAQLGEQELPVAEGDVTLKRALAAVRKLGQRNCVRGAAAKPGVQVAGRSDWEQLRSQLLVRVAGEGKVVKPSGDGIGLRGTTTISITSVRWVNR